MSADPVALGAAMASLAQRLTAEGWSMTVGSDEKSVLFVYTTLVIEKRAVVRLLGRQWQGFRLEVQVMGKMAPSNGGVRCDVTRGPCACGAWHERREP